MPRRNTTSAVPKNSSQPAHGFLEMNSLIDISNCIMVSYRFSFSVGVMANCVDEILFTLS